MRWSDQRVTTYPPQPDSTVARPLFRSDAKVPVRARLEGEVLLAIPPSLKVTGALLISVLMAFGVFAAVVEMPRTATAAGWLQPVGGVIRTIAPANGTAERVWVMKGQSVRSGQPVVSVGSAQHLAGAGVQHRASQDLHAEQLALSDELGSRQRELQLLQAAERVNQSFVERQISEASVRLTLAERKLGLTRAALTRAEGLLREGAYAEAQIERDRAAVLDDEMIVSTARATLLQLEADLRTVQKSIASYDLQQVSAEASYRRDAALVEQKEAAALRDTSYELVAPVDSDVLALLVEQGQSVRANDTLALLSPSGAELIARLYVPSHASGNLAVGQHVRIEFEAYPSAQYGETIGVISSVDDAFVQADELLLPEQSSSAPVVRVNVKLPRQTIDVPGRSQRLHSGMLIRGKIVLEKRSILDWVLSSIFRKG